jgi:hypothetical protein
MSILRDLAVFLVSGLFTISIFMAITSYTIGDSLQRDNLKSFLESSMAPSLLEDQCDEFCVNFTGEQKQACAQICIEQVGNKTAESVSKAVDDVYETSFYGITIDQLVYLMSQLTLFIVLSFASGALILVLSEEPLGHIGKNLITIAVSLLIASFSPNLLMSFSNVPVDKMITDYLGQGLEMQTMIAAVFIASGIALMAANYFLKRRKKKAVNKKATEKKK